MLVTYQTQDQLRTQQIQQSLSQLIDLEIACAQDPLKDFQAISQLIAAVDPLSDQALFIAQHRSEDLQEHVRFRPYIGTFPVKQEWPLLTVDWLTSLHSRDPVSDMVEQLWTETELTDQVCVHRSTAHTSILTDWSGFALSLSKEPMPPLRYLPLQSSGKLSKSC